MNLAYLEIDYDRSSFDAMEPQLREAFTERLVFSWLYHEHALEGIVLTQEDITRALSGQPARNYCDGRVQKSLKRMHGLVHMLLDQPRQTRPALGLEWLKDMHAALCDAGAEEAGRYRKRDTSPGVYNLDVVPSASISYYLHKFLDLYHDELRKAHPVRAAAMAHWEFMKVFPFDERTGFVGRLMLNDLLVKNGYAPAIIHAGDRHLYFSALNGHRSDLVPVIVEAVGATNAAADAFSRASCAPSPRRAAY